MLNDSQGNSERRSRRNGNLRSKGARTRNVSARRIPISAPYPVNDAWSAEMRIDTLARYLDFRTVRELTLAISRGEAPPPTNFRGVGRSREPVWAKIIVDEFVAPHDHLRQNRSRENLAALV
jgi:hypothetical protein